MVAYDNAIDDRILWKMQKLQLGRELIPTEGKKCLHAERVVPLFCHVRNDLHVLLKISKNTLGLFHLKTWSVGASFF